jgi:flagellar biosynthesis protein FlhF
MLVKTFEAMNMQDAVKAIKRDLGQDAVILNTREKKLADNGGRMVEVTAAVPQTKTRDPRASEQPSEQGALNESLASFDRKLASLASNLPSRRHMDTIDSGLQELKLLLLENLRDREGSPLQGLPIPLANVIRQLQVMGIEEGQMAKLAQYLRGLQTAEESLRAKPEEQEHLYRTHAMRWMLKRVKISLAWALTPGRASCHALVGPSGCGKTTTIAKLAAHYHLREKARVLVISWDNYRLAAADQLRTYCKIIGVPFIGVNSAEEIARHLADSKDRDLILIDTAGRNARNAKQIKELEAIKNISANLDIHLAVSVTEKESQLDQCVRSFSSLGLQSLIFTKLDSASSFGDIYNLSTRWSLPLSWFGTGQDVPEDLERSTRERLVERIFGI